MQFGLGRSTLFFAGVACVWTLAIWAVLQIGRLPDPEVDVVCGPWGCGPTLPDLAAYHAFWAVVLSVPTAAAARRLSVRTARRLGAALVVVGVLAVAAIGVHEAVYWSGDSEWRQGYLLQRWAFAVGTNVDLPVVQLAAAGALLFCLSPFVHRRVTVDLVEPATAVE